MSNIQILEREINSISTNFNEIAQLHGAVNFQKEASFAIQALKQNSYLMSVAYNNPESLQFAVMNIASIGLSLNPASKHAYLVPRGKGVCLDISYMGLIQLACASGGIKWVQAELVCEKDTFKTNGVGQKPDHSFSPFGDRGAYIGAYVVAKTEDDEFLTTIMSIEEAYAIRDRTEAWKAYKAGKVSSCPWSTDEGEMIKKTVIKRAFKTWPRNDKRMNDAVSILDNDNGEGIDFNKEKEIPKLSKSQKEEIEESLKVLSRNESQFLGYFSNVIKRNVESVSDLDMNEAEQALIQLRTMVNNNKETKKEA